MYSGIIFIVGVAIVLEKEANAWGEKTIKWHHRKKVLKATDMWEGKWNQATPFKNKKEFQDGFKQIFDKLFFSKFRSQQILHFWVF